MRKSFFKTIIFLILEMFCVVNLAHSLAIDFNARIQPEDIQDKIELRQIEDRLGALIDKGDRSDYEFNPAQLLDDFVGYFKHKQDFYGINLVDVYKYIFCIKVKDCVRSGTLTYEKLLNSVIEYYGNRKFREDIDEIWTSLLEYINFYIFTLDVDYKEYEDLFCSFKLNFSNNGSQIRDLDFYKGYRSPTPKGGLCVKVDTDKIDKKILKYPAKSPKRKQKKEAFLDRKLKQERDKKRNQIQKEEEKIIDSKIILEEKIKLLEANYIESKKIERVFKQGVEEKKKEKKKKFKRNRKKKQDSNVIIVQTEKVIPEADYEKPQELISGMPSDKEIQKIILKRQKQVEFPYKKVIGITLGLVIVGIFVYFMWYASIADKKEIKNIKKIKPKRYTQKLTPAPKISSFGHGRNKTTHAGLRKISSPANVLPRTPRDQTAKFPFRQAGSMAIVNRVSYNYKNKTHDDASGQVQKKIDSFVSDIQTFNGKNIYLKKLINFLDKSCISKNDQIYGLSSLEVLSRTTDGLSSFINNKVQYFQDKWQINFTTIHIVDRLDPWTDFKSIPNVKKAEVLEGIFKEYRSFMKNNNVTDAGRKYFSDNLNKILIGRKIPKTVFLKVKKNWELVEKLVDNKYYDVEDLKTKLDLRLADVEIFNSPNDVSISA